MPPRTVIELSDRRLMASQMAECGFPPTLFWEPAEVRQLVAQAHQAGWSVALHCHGDIGIESALDAIAAAMSTSDSTDARHRLEHASYPTTAQVRRMHDLNVTSVAQPAIVHNYGDQLLTRYGSAAKRTQPLAEEVAAGVNVVLSGDNILPIDPLKVMAMAMTRTTRSGAEIGSDQVLDFERALRGYTWDAAVVLQVENRVGSLEPGKKADLIAFATDPFSATPEELSRTSVSMTMVDGQIIQRT